ncbi:MAG: ABC transporter permease [Actinomycetes bacterium]|jgi:simple sugar transport system permease protein|nr:ABC transporter permease [Actinomycetes bacterium]
MSARLRLPFMLTKRPELSPRATLVARLAAVALSLVFAGLVLLLFGLNPLQVFGSILEGSLGTKLRIQQTVVKAVPLTIASLGILVAFKMKFWNIGGEGQIMMGALGASLVALNAPVTWPAALMLSVMAAAGIVFGAAWALVPAVFKVRFGTNETIFTLMMNYLAIKFVTYLQYGPWRDPASAGFPKIAPYPENAVLPRLFGVHIGWVIALVLVGGVYLFLTHTKKGYEISVVGESIDTARYAGMNIGQIVIVALSISGGLCGLVGMIQASAIEKTLTSGISANYGFTAIITAWLSRLNAIVVLIVCVAFAMLLQGAAFIQLQLQVPASVAEIVEGAILFFVLGSEFFLSYRLSRRGGGVAGGASAASEAAAGAASEEAIA